jgi:hypothetical protein
MLTKGLELARTLISHEWSSLVNLLPFIIARRMLKPAQLTEAEQKQVAEGVARSRD